MPFPGVPLSENRATELVKSFRVQPTALKKGCALSAGNNALIEALLDRSELENRYHRTEVLETELGQY